jgi:hypothetical protein
MVSGIGGFEVPAFGLYQRLSKGDTAKQAAQFAAQNPQVKKEIEYFRQKAATVKSVDEFFKDQRLLKFALSAYSLEAEQQFPARIQKIMTSDPKDPKSLANRMLDPRYSEINKDFQFGQQDVANLKLTKFIDKVVEKYATSEYEKKLGEQNPALREAAYFKRKIGDVKDVYQILGDKVLRGVVFDTLGIPAEVANQSLEKQADLVKKGFKLDKVKDKTYVDNFLKRFIVARDRQQAQEQASTGFSSGSAALSLFSGGRLNIYV